MLQQRLVHVAQARLEGLKVRTAAPAVVQPRPAILVEGMRRHELRLGAARQRCIDQDHVGARVGEAAKPAGALQPAALQLRACALAVQEEASVVSRRTPGMVCRARRPRLVVGGAQPGHGRRRGTDGTDGTDGRDSRHAHGEQRGESPQGALLEHDPHGGRRTGRGGAYDAHVELEHLQRAQLEEWRLGVEAVVARNLASHSDEAFLGERVLGFGSSKCGTPILALGGGPALGLAGVQLPKGRASGQALEDELHGLRHAPVGGDLGRECLRAATQRRVMQHAVQRGGKVRGRAPALAHIDARSRILHPSCPSRLVDPGQMWHNHRRAACRDDGSGGACSSVVDDASALRKHIHVRGRRGHKRPRPAPDMRRYEPANGKQPSAAPAVRLQSR